MKKVLIARRFSAGIPEFLVSHDGTDLVWKDGTRMSVGDARSDTSFEEKLRKRACQNTGECM